MGKRWPLAVGITLLAVVAPAQAPDFAATAPPKVNLPLSEPPVESTAEPTDAAQAPATPDPVLEGIAEEWDRIEAETPEEAGGAAAAPPQDAPAASPWKTALNAVKALCITLALLLVIVAAVKRWGRRTPLLAGQHLARVIGRVGLSPQASLHFVQTNGEVLLVGVTPQSVTLLRTFDAVDFEAPAAGQETASETAVPPATSFLAQLKEARALPAVETAVDEDLDKLKGELQRLKQYFQENARGRE